MLLIFLVISKKSKKNTNWRNCLNKRNDFFHSKLCLPNNWVKKRGAKLATKASKNPTNYLTPILKSPVVYFDFGWFKRFHKISQVPSLKWKLVSRHNNWGIFHGRVLFLHIGRMKWQRCVDLWERGNRCTEAACGYVSEGHLEREC